MSSFSKTRGSAHIITIIVLVVALISVLGVVFYQNFIVKSKDSARDASKTTSTAANVVQQPAAKLLNASLSDGFGVKLSFDYPSDWSFSRTTTGPLPIIERGEVTDEKMTVASPSGKFSVHYRVVSTDGYGGVCVPDETGAYVTASYQELTKFSGISYFEATTTAMPITDDGTHSVGEMSLIKTDAAKLSVAGASVCVTGYAGMIALNSNGITLVGPGVTIAGTKTAEEFKAAAKGTEYEQAKAILLSTAH